MEKLSGVMIIIIIGGGVLTFVMLFIFGKRQIMRFTLRSRRGHVPVGNDAKKALRKEIERRLDCIQKIAQEPKLLWQDDDKYILQPDKSLPPYYYRMKAVDDVKILEKEISRSHGSARHPYDSIRAFLLTTLSATLNGTGQRMIHQFCDMYEHARHDPNEFGSEEYEAYHRLLLKLIEAAKQLKALVGSRKTSPARTPKKQTKMQSLLDPARLRPPPLNSSSHGTPPTSELTAGHQSKVNLTLGLQAQHQLHHADGLHDEDDDDDINDNNSDKCNADIAPLHLHETADHENEIIIRNRMKTTPKLDDTVVIDNRRQLRGQKDSGTDEDNDNESIILDDNEIMSISSVQYQGSGIHSNTG